MLTLASSAVAALVVASLVERWGNSLTIVSGSVLIGSAMLVVPFVHDVSLLMVVMVVSGFGRGVLATILMSLSVQAVAARQKATAMGIYQATYAVGMILGPLISGSLADSQGLVAVFYLSASLCLVIAGMALLPVVAKYQKDY
jgi:MFS family permease